MIATDDERVERTTLEFLGGTALVAPVTVIIGLVAGESLDWTVAR